jgi:hypothetical protein
MDGCKQITDFPHTITDMINSYLQLICKKKTCIVSKYIITLHPILKQLQQ